MNLRYLLSIGAAGLAVSSFAQVTGTLTLDSSDSIGVGYPVGFDGLTHATFAPDQSFNLPTTQFEVFCTDLMIPAYYGTGYEDTQVTTGSFYSLNQAPTPSPQLGSEISWIANTYGFTSNADTAASAQLAIWLIQGTSLSDISGYLGSPVDPGDAAQAANIEFDAEFGYALGLRSSSPWYESPFDGYPNQVTQNFVQPVATPESSGHVVLGVALLGIFLRRRAVKKD